MQIERKGCTVENIMIGHFSPYSRAIDQASSPAGNQVQRKILKELSDQCGSDAVACYSMAPQPSWPVGPIFVDTESEGEVTFLGYLNFPVIKHFCFACSLLLELFKYRPRFVIQYNSFVFENIAILVYRILFIRAFVCVIVQDIHITLGSDFFSRLWFRSIFEWFGLFLARNFDLIVPVSYKIIKDFNMEPSKCIVFQGGVTDFAEKIIHSDMSQLSEIGVFAGALEPYNGVDRLINQWLCDDIDRELHIFGRGSLESMIREASLRYDKIIYHGFQSEDDVIFWLRKARWNFCFRYNEGLNEAYFFPSKFFNILCAPGVVIVNDFYGLPAGVRNFVCVVPDELSTLKKVMAQSLHQFDSNLVSERKHIVQKNYSWHACIKSVLDIRYKAGG